MTTHFPAWIVRQHDGRNTASFEDVTINLLDDLDTTVRVQYSGINYKDALALGGRPGVIRRTPLIPGIDLTGEVTHSQHPNWRPGDIVTLNGAELGESLHGGLASIARVNGDDLIRVPKTFTPRQVAAIGTAGFTAALSVLALERHGLTPAGGPVLVTGAGGGTGNTAISLLAHSGYEVIAATGRTEELRPQLTALGAATVIDREELETQTRPLSAQRWAGVVDAAGGAILAGALSGIRHGGAAAAFGLAADSRLHTTVLPFILRGVSLLGIDSVHATPADREAAWDRLSRHLSPAHLDAITHVVPLEQAHHASVALINGRGTGRTVVEVAH